MMVNGQGYKEPPFERLGEKEEHPTLSGNMGPSMEYMGRAEKRFSMEGNEEGNRDSHLRGQGRREEHPPWSRDS